MQNTSRFKAMTRSKGTRRTTRVLPSYLLSKTQGNRISIKHINNLGPSKAAALMTTSLSRVEGMAILVMPMKTNLPTKENEVCETE